HVPLDFATAEGELRELSIPDDGLDPDAVFHREWVRALFSRAVERLREDCQREDRAVSFALFREYDLDGPAAGERVTYAQLAERHGMDVTTVTNRLHAVRKRFRATVLECLRETAATDEEFREEARELLGVSLPGGDSGGADT
ncbi:MAG: sigma-70 family RNA polymerase sigma factor, partial [Gemmatimonadetes bacterium]|nr:sigma-70 family RNA polymerase sigma factor [Gemmatimonadota bacterium]